MGNGPPDGACVVRPAGSGGAGGAGGGGGGVGGRLAAVVRHRLGPCHGRCAGFGAVSRHGVGVKAKPFGRPAASPEGLVLHIVRGSGRRWPVQSRLRRRRRPAVVDPSSSILWTLLGTASHRCVPCCNHAMFPVQSPSHISKIETEPGVGGAPRSEGGSTGVLPTSEVHKHAAPAATVSAGHGRAATGAGIACVRPGVRCRVGAASNEGCSGEDRRRQPQAAVGGDGPHLVAFWSKNSTNVRSETISAIGQVAHWGEPS
jgi:hypothetical protein